MASQEKETPVPEAFFLIEPATRTTYGCLGDSVPRGGLELEDLGSTYRRNADGSWTCVKAATLQGPNGRMQVSEGTTYRRGMLYMGVELAKWLDEQLGFGGADSR